MSQEQSIDNTLITVDKSPETRWQPITTASVKSPLLTSQNPVQQLAQKPRKLTRKQAAFIQHLVDNPKESATQAVAEVYGKPGKDMARHTAEVIASENLRKPEIMAELAKYDQTAQVTMVEVMQYSKELGKQGNSAGASYAANALTAAKDLLDRLHGKSTQRVETTSTTVNLNLNLSDVIDSKQ